MTWSPPSALHASAPYRGKPFPQTHPDRLATVGGLFGLQTAPPGKCRVLELGCGDGGNLIPMAFGAPESEFVGVDLNAERIARGNAWLGRLGLSNARLEARDIAEIGSEYGEFDYVVAHGVYSWIPEALRPKLLAICKQSLREQGVAYVSFNALPGWHQLSMLREFSLFHAGNARAGTEREALLKQIRALSQLFADEQPSGSAQGALFKSLFQRLATTSDYLLLYDYLGETSTPVHLCDFVEHAREQGLTYFADANFFEVEFNRLPRRARSVVGELTRDAVLREQYADFFNGRLFRRSLLCHADRKLAAPQAERVEDFYLASNPKPLSAVPNPGSDDPESFDMPHGSRINVASPIVKTALLRLRDAWPCSVRLAELVEHVRERLSEAPVTRDLAGARGILVSACWDLYAAGALELRSAAPACVPTVSERPRSSELGRSQLEFGDSVTNQLHDHTRLLDPLSRELFGRLDGARDRAALARELSELAASGKLEGAPSSSAALATEIDKRLATWAKHALLVG
jgi:SAM-dependent methyltransferase